MTENGNTILLACPRTHYLPIAGVYTEDLSWTIRTRRYTIDGDYLIGDLPGIERITVATGCNGSMLSAAGGVGRLVAAQVLRQLDLPTLSRGVESSAIDTECDVAETVGCGKADRVLEAFGAAKWDPGRFVGNKWNSEVAPFGGGDVYSAEFRAQCAAVRGRKFEN